MIRLASCLLLLCGRSWTYNTIEDNEIEDIKDTPRFSPTYIVNATMFIPYAEIMEPFTAYFDAESGASRIDYYGDMVKTYQIMVNNSFGVMSKVAPVTTEDSLNVKTCLQINGTTEMGPITPQSVVPDMSLFKFVGKDIARGIPAEKWEYVEAVGDVVSKYTMFLTYQKSSKSDHQTPVPVKFVMKGMNIVFGSHYDHYWIEYAFDRYSDEKPDPDIFQIKEMACHPFPGPGINHLYTFNPMKEFMDLTQDHISDRFEKYKHEHGKEYPDASEHAIRSHYFRHNLRYINSRNRANLSYKLAANHLTDRSEVELKALLGRQHTAKSEFNGGLPFPYDVKKEMNEVPKSLDWRWYGAVTPVKDQSVCGSCWSFGTTGAVEGTYFVHSGILLRLSQQALIDCSWGFGNNGCDGGEDFRSYEWIIKHGGLPTEEDYGPYYGQDGYCHVQNTTLVAPVSGFVNVTPNDAKALKLATSLVGPISVAIYASLKSFAFYHSGIYEDPDCKTSLEDLNHAVLVVGYGAIYEKPFWLVKNSWSNRWGNDGYILMSREVNTCGILTIPTYPVFK